MTDELLDFLGNYFVTEDIRAKKGITFEEFLNTWRDIIPAEKIA